MLSLPTTAYAAPKIDDGGISGSSIIEPFASVACRGITGMNTTKGGTNYPTTTNGSKNRSCYVAQDVYRFSVAAEQLQISIIYGEKISLGPFGADGYYGNASIRAMQTIQKRYALYADGVYGPVTGKKMNWYGLGKIGKWK